MQLHIHPRYYRIIDKQSNFALTPSFQDEKELEYLLRNNQHGLCGYSTPTDAQLDAIKKWTNNIIKLDIDKDGNVILEN